MAPPARVVAFAASFSGPSRLVRLLPNGILDSSFGVDGRVVLPLAGVPGKPAGGLVVERSGAVLTGGIVLDGEDGGARHVGVVRLDERGRLDHTFGGATAPFLLQPGVSVTDSLAPSGVSLLAAPQVTAASGCEPEVVVRFEQRGGRVHVFR